MFSYYYPGDREKTLACELKAGRVENRTFKHFLRLVHVTLGTYPSSSLSHSRHALTSRFLLSFCSFNLSFIPSIICIIPLGIFIGLSSSIRSRIPSGCHGIVTSSSTHQTQAQYHSSEIPTIFTCFLPISDYHPEDDSQICYCRNR